MNDFEANVLPLADALRARGERLATAESCTGGLIAAACTSVAGSSDWFERGFVTYSNDAKIEMLAVPAATLATQGAVSEAVVRAMADGAIARSPAHWAIAVTGIAGPTGGVPGKPVGTVWLAIGRRGHGAVSTLLQLSGDRAAVRGQTTTIALRMLLDALASA